MSKRFWLNFESYLQSKLPKYLKDILTSTGFDNELSISSINSDSVSDIEKFVSENKHLLKDTIYEKSCESSFKFLPGHRRLLLLLPNRFSEYKNLKRTKQTRKGKDGEVLQDELLEKLNKVSYLKNAGVKLSKTNVIEFSDDNKCRVKCPLCSKIFACIYKSYWMISNIKRHWKNSHFNENGEIAAPHIEFSIEKIDEHNQQMLFDLIEVDSNADYDEVNE